MAASLSNSLSGSAVHAIGRASGIHSMTLMLLLFKKCLSIFTTMDRSYRGRRMINWDPAAQTAVSDEEVISKPQKGHLYFVRYEIVER